MFEGYLGQALCVARVDARLSQREVLDELNKRRKSDFSLALFDGMEKDVEDIDAETFEAWCALLPYSKEGVLKHAQLLQQGLRQSGQKTAQAAKDDIDYKLWELEQENE